MQLLDDRDVFKRAWFDGLVPPEDLTVTEWAERHRKLSGEASIQPGDFRCDKTPYVREILDSLHPESPYREVVWMKGSQIAGSETANNWIGYLIAQCPGPIMMVQPTKDTARRYSRTRIAPMLRDSPRLAEIVPPNKSRDGDNTIFMKTFRGGVLLIVGANSAAELRSQPIRFLIEDEVDNWPVDVDGEGDPCKLAEARQRWSGDRAKTYKLSSPKFKGSSRIEGAYQQGDQRRYYVPCPHCDHMQVLVWDNLKYEPEKPETAMYMCEACASLISEAFKAEMLERGEWRATVVPINPKTRSYHLSSLYSPPGAMSWADIVREFIEAKKAGASLLQVWTNTVLGETWEVKGEAPPADLLHAQAGRETYESGEIPPGVLLLTAGVDVQGDRIEVEVVGWGRDQESWSIQYFIFEGDPVLPAVWEKLDELLERTWVHPTAGIEMTIGRMAIDCAYDQTTVGAWVRRKSPSLVIGIHGNDRLNRVLGHVQRVELTRKGKAVRGGFLLWPVGVSVVKTNLYGRLRIRPPVEKGEKYQPGYCHFPRDYGIEHFRQLTAEKLVFVETKTGGVKPEWHKVRDRNEALDCRVYATAAAHAYGVTRMQDSHWDEHEEALGIAAGAAAVQAPVRAKPTARARARKAEDPDEPDPTPRPSSAAKPTRERSGWMSRWHGSRQSYTKR